MGNSGVYFNYVEQRFTFPRRTELKRFLHQVAQEEGHSIEALSYIFCSDEYLLAINQAHLDHDTYTDIITFPYNQPGTPLESDVFISVDRVRENATSFQVPFLTELYRVIFHGLLHLCGYKDKSAKDQKLMRKREEYWLSRYESSTWNEGH